MAEFDWRPRVGQEIRITIDSIYNPETGKIETESKPRTYSGTVLDFDESGEFALVWWEDGTRDYRYLHQGYDAQMNETMEW